MFFRQDSWLHRTFSWRMQYKQIIISWARWFASIVPAVWLETTLTFPLTYLRGIWNLDSSKQNYWFHPPRFSFSSISISDFLPLAVYTEYNRCWFSILHFSCFKFRPSAGPCHPSSKILGECPMQASWPPSQALLFCLDYSNSTLTAPHFCFATIIHSPKSRQMSSLET